MASIPKVLLDFEGHADEARAGCILSMFFNRRDMLRLVLSKLRIIVVKLLVDSSARSIELLPRKM